MAFTWISKGVDLGNVHCMGMMANYLCRGKGVQKNTAYSLGVMFQAAGGGSSWAQCNLGWYFEKGMYGLPIDLARALFWYKKGCSHLANSNDPLCETEPFSHALRALEAQP